MKAWDMGPSIRGSEANPLRIVARVLELASAVWVLVGGGVVDSRFRT